VVTGVVTAAAAVTHPSTIRIGKTITTTMAVMTPRPPAIITDNRIRITIPVRSTGVPTCPPRAVVVVVLM